jgi:hypothetical protein
MADNVRLSAGSNDGANMRALETAAGVKFATSTLAYATTLSPGANVVVDVSPDNPLPVAATLAAPVEIAAGQSVSIAGTPAVTLSGVDAENPLPVAAELSAPVEIAADQSVSIAGTASVALAGIDAANRLPVASTLVGSVVVDEVANPVLVQHDPAAPFVVASITNPVLVTLEADQTINVGAPVEIAAGQTIAADQSGAWSVSILGTPAVAQSGSWVFGLAAGQTLAAVTAVGSITNPVALAAGANLIGKASVGADTSTIYNGATALTPKFAKIQASSSGDNAIVAGVSGKKIRVLNWAFSANGTVAVKWRSNTTDVTGPRYLIQYASAGRSGGPNGVMETAAGEALNLNLSAAVAVGGELAYIEV